MQRNFIQLCLHITQSSCFPASDTSIWDHLLLWLGQLRTILITRASPSRQARRRLHQALLGWPDTNAGELPHSAETVAAGDAQRQSKLLLVSGGSASECVICEVDLRKHHATHPVANCSWQVALHDQNRIPKLSLYSDSRSCLCDCLAD